MTPVHQENLLTAREDFTFRVSAYPSGYGFLHVEGHGVEFSFRCKVDDMRALSGGLSRCATAYEDHAAQPKPRFSPRPLFGAAGFEVSVARLNYGRPCTISVGVDHTGACLCISGEDSTDGQAPLDLDAVKALISGLQKVEGALTAMAAMAAQVTA